VKYSVVIKLDCESEYDELTVIADWESAIIEAVQGLLKADRLTSASNMDVDVIGED
jgi:hypothetical protein